MRESKANEHRHSRGYRLLRSVAISKSCQPTALASTAQHHPVRHIDQRRTWLSQSGDHLLLRETHKPPLVHSLTLAQDAASQELVPRLRVPGAVVLPVCGRAHSLVACRTSVAC